MSTLMSLFEVCAKQNYHSRCLKEIHIISLKKSNKSNYTNLKTYKLIALFNTLDKTLKSIIVRRINNLTKTHKLFFETQINERRQKTCKTTLKLFTKQIHIVWNMSKNKMTTLLNVNVIDAYNHVSRKDWFIIYAKNAFLIESLFQLIISCRTNIQRLKKRTVDVHEFNQSRHFAEFFFFAHIIYFL
jgi:hypothetical protein